MPVSEEQAAKEKDPEDGNEDGEVQEEEEMVEIVPQRRRSRRQAAGTAEELEDISEVENEMIGFFFMKINRP